MPSQRVDGGRAERAWRGDPTWRLIWYDSSVFTQQPPNAPSVAAELANPPIWASEYRDHRMVATWARARS